MALLNSPSDDRLQVDLYMCAPHGEYELILEHNSVNGKYGATTIRPLRWEIENGPDEVLWTAGQNVVVDGWVDDITMITLFP